MVLIPSIPRQPNMHLTLLANPLILISIGKIHKLDPNRQESPISCHSRMLLASAHRNRILKTHFSDPKLMLVREARSRPPTVVNEGQRCHRSPQLHLPRKLAQSLIIQARQPMTRSHYGQGRKSLSILTQSNREKMKGHKQLKLTSRINKLQVRSNLSHNQMK